MIRAYTALSVKLTLLFFLEMMELPYFKLHPLNNQVVYQNDSISIKCSATWQPRGYLAWHKDGYEISHGFNDVTFFQNNDIVEKRNESTLLIRRYVERDVELCW